MELFYLLFFIFYNSAMWFKKVYCCWVHMGLPRISCVSGKNRVDGLLFFMNKGD